MNELEKDIAEVKADIKDIKDNHLTSLNERISKIKQSLARQGGILAVVLILLSVILAKVLGVI